jgi:hypothetical protein
MYSSSLLLSALFALTATAKPINTNLIERSSASSSPDTFNIEICNNCPADKHFGIYEITGSFQMLQTCDPVTVGQGESKTISAPYKGIGMRLSGHAEWGTGGQWAPQALFEFGYSEYNGLEGTAYDLSLMQGSESDVGLAVYPILSDDASSSDCPNKICYPGNCDPSQGWTNPDQVSDGSPADTVCYHGKMDFKVVFCP